MVKACNLRMMVIFGIMAVVHSTIYSVDEKWVVSFTKNNNELAHCHYEQQTFTNGANILHIYGNENKGRLDQVRAAGFLEGYATFREIYAAYRNLQINTIKGPSVSLPLHKYITSQWAFLQKMVATF